MKREDETLKIVFVGHVDHGKSTLIGRILHDTGSLPEGKIESIEKACAAEGMEFEYAFLLDALLEEQEQNITIDTTQIPFRTARRQYMIIDAPGHKEFLKNMITGASSADAAILVIAANEGVQEQSRRHAYLLSLLGIRQIVVVVNKMDLAGYDEKRFQEIEREYRAFLSELGLEARIFVPASAKHGENVARKSAKKMKWHRGPTVLEAFDQLEPPKAPTELPLRFCVQDVYRFDERRIIAGRIETGVLRVGTISFSHPRINRARSPRSRNGTRHQLKKRLPEIPSASLCANKSLSSEVTLHRIKPTRRSRRTDFMPMFSGWRTNRCGWMRLIQFGSRRRN